MSIVELRPPQDGPFAIGSIVALKGGGIIMTVRKATKNEVLCDWQNASSDPITFGYHPDMLYHADEEEKPDGGG